MEPQGTLKNAKKFERRHRQKSFLELPWLRYAKPAAKNQAYFDHELEFIANLIANSTILSKFLRIHSIMHFYDCSFSNSQSGTPQSRIDLLKFKLDIYIPVVLFRI
jgi:hypothetical protein